MVGFLSMRDKKIAAFGARKRNKFIFLIIFMSSSFYVKHRFL